MNCNLTGSIPDSIFDANNLELFNLDNNAFTGTLSTRFGSLIELKYLWLAGNNFDGTIPSQIGNIPYLSKCIYLLFVIFCSNINNIHD